MFDTSTSTFDGNEPLTFVSVSDPSDPDVVFRRLRYWEYLQGRPSEKYPEKDVKESTSKYVTFYKDCGGFNNIRMGFEHAILMAWFMKRTLVIHPNTPWYLIDFGPFHGKKPGDASGVSSYADWFDMDDLAKGIPTLETSEFVEKEQDAMGIPERFLGIDRQDKSWKRWLEGLGHDMQWSPLDVAILHPTISDYQRDGPPEKQGLAGARRKVEYAGEMVDWKVVNFPSCNKPGGMKDKFRFLGQVAGTVLFADQDLEKDYKSFLRHHVHFRPLIFKLASRIIAKMGMFQYSAYHIRRNDLQYPESYQAAEGTLYNTKALLNEGEPLYIATDETQSGFFDTIAKTHPVKRWADFVDDDDLRIDGLEIPRKVIGCVEQIICAGGRRFFGTRSSTFTSYIFRIRGYIGAPDTKQYWHNIRYTGISEVDDISQPTSGVDGTDYMLEFPDLWTDLISV